MSEHKCVRSVGKYNRTDGGKNAIPSRVLGPKQKTPYSSQHLLKVNYGENRSNILACVLNDRGSVLLLF